MDMAKLWKEKKWLFFLLLPVVVAVVGFVQLYQKFQVHQAEKTVANAEKKNKKLEEKIQQNEVKIAEKKAQIEEKKRQMDERKPEDVPLDWHKSFKE